MTVVTGIVLDDDGRPAPTVYVSAELVASSRWLADSPRLIEGREDAYTDIDGRWRLNLPPRSAMRDEAAWWRVRVWNYGTFGVVVPDDPGRDVELSEPGVLRPPFDDEPPPAVGDPDTPTGVPLVYVRDAATGEYRLVPYTEGAPLPETFALDDLADVTTDGATAGQVLVRGEDGVWYPDAPTGGSRWGDAVAFAAAAPDPDTAPDSAVWVELGPDLRIHRKAP